MASISEVFNGEFGEEKSKSKPKPKDQTKEKPVSTCSESPTQARQQPTAKINLQQQKNLPISSMIPCDGEEDDAEKRIVEAADKYLDTAGVGRDKVVVVEKEKPVYVVKPVGWRHLAGWIVAAFLGGALIALVGVS